MLWCFIFDSQWKTSGNYDQSQIHIFASMLKTEIVVSSFRFQSVALTSSDFVSNCSRMADEATTSSNFLCRKVLLKCWNVRREIEADLTILRENQHCRETSKFRVISCEWVNYECYLRIQRLSMLLIRNIPWPNVNIVVSSVLCSKLLLDIHIVLKSFNFHSSQCPPSIESLKLWIWS